MSGNGNTKSELMVSLMKKDPKFKAGSELSGSVNRLHVDWNNDETEDAEILTITLHLERECLEEPSV